MTQLSTEMQMNCLTMTWNSNMGRTGTICRGPCVFRGAGACTCPSANLNEGKGYRPAWRVARSMVVLDFTSLPAPPVPEACMSLT